MKSRLLSIHFETLTSSRDSLSCIGIALYEDDNIKVKKEIRMDLYENNRDSFLNILKEINILMDENTLVISPNSAFDISVIRYFCDKFEVEYPTLEYLCTWKLSQILYGEEEEEIESKTPMEKAVECINEYKKILLNSSYKNIDELLNNHHIEKGKLLKNSYSPFGMNKKQNKLYRKNIVFTGGLSAMRRAEAFKRVASIGAIPSNSVSKNTNILVIGDQGLRKFNTRGKSSKMLSAEKLISQGFNLQIISENEFLDILNSKK
ncbi:hypothetical protein [Romboutsia sp.]|uniref:hypothetical protein n=1 Tax=Romboutsia sp. TaxID=1965302 RepID=UPI003F2BCCF3